MRIPFGLLAIMALALAGCAGQIHVSQPPDQALVRAGSLDAFVPAATLGGAFAEYALLADQTYNNDVYTSGRPVLSDGEYWLSVRGGRLS